MSKKYGYARVSSREQNESRQLEELKGKGVEHIFIEKVSGKNFERTVYKKLRRVLKQDDILYIESVDRLGRTYDGIISEWNYLVKKKKIQIKVIGNPLLDTGEDTALITKFNKDLLLLISAYQSEQEYLNIKGRQAQGIAIAKKSGKKLGRPKKEVPKEHVDIIAKWRKGELSSKTAMNTLELKKSAFYNLVERIE